MILRDLHKVVEWSDSEKFCLAWFGKRADWNCTSNRYLVFVPTIENGKMGRNFVFIFFVCNAKSSLSYYFERIKRASSLILIA